MSMAPEPATQANHRVQGGPTSMTAGAVPPEIETFLLHVADSFIKIELIKFFHRNQRLLGTLEDIAVSIGRDKRTTARAIPHLLSAGVLQATGRGGAALWTYEPAPPMTERIDAFLTYYNTERGRRAIVRRILEEEG
jgi:hypothetical protein